MKLGMPLPRIPSLPKDVIVRFWLIALFTLIATVTGPHGIGLARATTALSPRKSGDGQGAKDCQRRFDGGGTAFADYVWKPVVLVEMKKRG